MKQTQPAATEGTSDNKGKVWKYNSEWEKDFPWPNYEAKAQLFVSTAQKQ